MGYSFRLVARVLLYASSHRQNNTYHSRCYTSCGTLAGTRNSSMGQPWRIDPMTPSHHEWTLLLQSYILLLIYGDYFKRTFYKWKECQFLWLTSMECSNLPVLTKATIRHPDTNDNLLKQSQTTVNTYFNSHSSQQILLFVVFICLSTNHLK